MRKDQAYINLLLDKYSRDEISAVERHELEKEALDDQFLFDAMEGFSKALENKEVKVKSNKLLIKKLLPYVTVAALMMGIVAVYLMQGMHEDKNSDMAMTLPQANKVPPTISDEKAEVQNEGVAMIGVQEGVKTVSAPDDRPQVKQITKTKEKLAPQKKNEETIADVSENRTSDKSQRHENVESKMEVEKPLYDNTTGAQPSPQTAGPVQSIGLAAGIDTSDKFKNVKLENVAYPVMGTEAFYNFFKRNLVKPSDNQAINFSGEVEVKFRVNEDGNLSQFNVQSTECKSCGEEIIRILKKSGKWATNPKGIRKETSIKVKF